MQAANSRQVGGKHYAGEYQHWDFVVEFEVHYLLACASKYTARASRKNGLEDLEKAQHFIQRYSEIKPKKERRRYTTRVVAFTEGIKKFTENCEDADRDLTRAVLIALYTKAGAIGRRCELAQSFIKLAIFKLEMDKPK